MTFEYYNPHVAPFDATLPSGRTIRVPSKAYVPTPEMEEEGFTEKAFREFLGPSFLSPTPPKKRRELLEAAKLTVPADLAERTRQLPPAVAPGARAGAPAGEPAQAGVTPPAPKGPAQPPKGSAPPPPPKGQTSQSSTPDMESEEWKVLQGATDKSASSYKGPKTEKP